MKYGLTSAAVLSLAVLTAGCSDKQEVKDLQQLPLDKAAGKQIAQQQCSHCHDLDGRGVSNDIPNLAAQNEAYLLKAFQTYNHGGRTRRDGEVMEVSGELSPADIRHVLGYYASLPPLTAPKTSLPTPQYSYRERGQALSQHCADCHGADGNPAEADMPRLAGQPMAYLKQTISDYQQRQREDAQMHNAVAGLTPAEIDNLSLYYALQTPEKISTDSQPSPSGKQLSYQCLSCHQSAEKETIPVLAGQGEDYLIRAIKTYRAEIRQHDEMHDTLSELDQTQIQQVAAFFASQHPEPAAVKPPPSVDSLHQKCIRCHNSQTDNPELVTPRLQGQNKQYLINALTYYRDGERDNSTMHRMSGVYSDAAIEAIATYYSQQSPSHRDSKIKELP